jgi:hypothetical protein
MTYEEVKVSVMDCRREEWREAGMKGTGSPVADNVGSAERETVTEAVVMVTTRVDIRVIVTIVADKRGLEASAREGWIAGVTDNLQDVGVGSVIDLIKNVLVLNTRLVDGGHRRLHDITLQALMEEACEIMFGPGSGGE